jgi:hypothetical protein
MYSSSTWSGECYLKVTKNDWRIVYSFREYQKHNFTSIEVAGSRISEYIQVLTDCFSIYEELKQMPFQELLRRSDLRDYFECSEKAYPLRLHKSAFLDEDYATDSTLRNIFKNTNIEIRLRGEEAFGFDGVCLGGYYEIRVDTKLELDTTISEWKYANERAMIIMPFLKIL